MAEHEISVGMPARDVLRAMGAPEAKTAGIIGGGPAETWLYVDYSRGYSSYPFGAGPTPGWGLYPGQHPFPSYHGYLNHSYSYYRMLRPFVFAYTHVGIPGNRFYDLGYSYVAVSVQNGRVVALRLLTPRNRSGTAF